MTRCPINVPRHAQTRLDEATQARHAKRPDHYFCDTVEQQFTHLSSLGVKWSQVQILSARLRKSSLDLLFSVAETAIMGQLLFVWDHVFGCEAFFGRTCPMVK